MTEQEQQTFDKKQLNITYGKAIVYLVGIVSVIISIFTAKNDLEQSILTEIHTNQTQDKDIKTLYMQLDKKTSTSDYNNLVKDVDNLRTRVNSYHGY